MVQHHPDIVTQLYHGLVKRKNWLPEPIGRVTLNWPLPLLTVLVMKIQATGGVRLVEEYNPQSLAQLGQLKVKKAAPELVTPKVGLGRKTLAVAELTLVPQALTAAT